MARGHDKDYLDREEARTLLEGRRSRIVADLKERSARLRDDKAGATTDVDGEVIDTGDLDASLIELATATLHHINRALDRLDSGHYGWCTRCQHRIAARRLRAMPFALRCRECESEREQEVHGASAMMRARPRPEPRRDADRGDW